MRYKFQEKRQSKKAREGAMGLGLRSSDVEDFLVDEEAINVAVDNHKRLSRYH